MSVLAWETVLVFLEECCKLFLGLPSDVHERDGRFAALNEVQATDLTFACLSCSGGCATVEESVPKRRDLGWCFLRIYPVRVVWLHSPVPDRECAPHPRLRTLHMVICSFATEQVSLIPCACKHAANDLEVDLVENLPISIVAGQDLPLLLITRVLLERHAHCDCVLELLCMPTGSLLNFGLKHELK